jgi:hypothetical protein
MSAKTPTEIFSLKLSSLFRWQPEVFRTEVLPHFV